MAGRPLHSRLWVRGRGERRCSVTHSFFCSKLNFMPLEQEMPVQFQVVELPGGHHLCKVRALNKGDANSEVTVYYQVSWLLYTQPSSCLRLVGH